MPENNLQGNSGNDVLLVMDETGELNVVKNDEEGPKDQLPPTPAKQIISLMDTGYEELALQPPPPMIRKTTASFYFHPEDEEEVAKALPPQGLQPHRQYSLDKILERIIIIFNLTLDADSRKRLRTIIYTYLRDRRSFVETQEVFKRSKANGGLELASEQSNQVLEFLKEVHDKIFQEKGLVIDEQVKIEEAKQKIPVYKPAPVNPVKQEVPLELKDVISKSETIEADVKEPVKLQDINSSIVQPPVTTPPTRVVESKPLLIDDSPKVLPRSKRPLKKGRAAMDDIQKDYKLVGPVEELSSLTLQNFRRLGSTTLKQAQKVLNKVNLLGKESLTRKSKGIQGWRRSPLYKMYLAIGQASMEHGLSVEKVINQYSSQGKEIMTLAEFEAISDLNKQFRF